MQARNRSPLHAAGGLSQSSTVPVRSRTSSPIPASRHRIREPLASPSDGRTVAVQGRRFRAYAHPVGAGDPRNPVTSRLTDMHGQAKACLTRRLREVHQCQGGFHAFWPTMLTYVLPAGTISYWIGCPSRLIRRANSGTSLRIQFTCRSLTVSTYLS